MQRKVRRVGSAAIWLIIDLFLLGGLATSCGLLRYVRLMMRVHPSGGNARNPLFISEYDRYNGSFAAYICGQEGRPFISLEEEAERY